MASSFFRQFAIDNGLTVDYGYTYGKYNDNFISIKEGLGSERVLTIFTTIAQDKESLKKVLSVYGEELPKYCITDMKREDKFIQFTFNLPNDNAYLIKEFFDIYFSQCEENGIKNEVICPLCNKVIAKDDTTSWADYHGNITPIHDNCFEESKPAIEEKKKETAKELNVGRRNYSMGALGAFLFTLIYIGLLTLVFFFVQFLLSASSSGNVPFENNGMSATVFQYAPILICLSASPIIHSGYEVFKGKIGNAKFFIILVLEIVGTIVGVMVGFVASLSLVDSSSTFFELFALVFKLLSGPYPSFRLAFSIYFIGGTILALTSLAFNFNNKKALEQANATTIEKLK